MAKNTNHQSEAYKKLIQLFAFANTISVQRRHHYIEKVHKLYIAYKSLQNANNNATNIVSDNGNSPVLQNGIAPSIGKELQPSRRGATRKKNVQSAAENADDNDNAMGLQNGHGQASTSKIKNHVAKAKINKMGKKRILQNANSNACETANDGVNAKALQSGNSQASSSSMSKEFQQTRSGTRSKRNLQSAAKNVDDNCNAIVLENELAKPKINKMERKKILKNSNNKAAETVNVNAMELQPGNSNSNIGKKLQQTTSSRRRTRTNLESAFKNIDDNRNAEVISSKFENQSTTITTDKNTRKNTTNKKAKIHKQAQDFNKHDVKISKNLMNTPAKDNLLEDLTSIKRIRTLILSGRKRLLYSEDSFIPSDNLEEIDNSEPVFIFRRNTQ